MTTFTFLVIISLLLLQVAGRGVAFPTIILQQHDGIFPNATNTTVTITGTVVSLSPTGFSSIIPTADPVKRYDSVGKPIDNHEILPGYGKEKRQRNVCHLSCDPVSLVDICESDPVLANCDTECSLQTTGMVPLGGAAVIGQVDTVIPTDAMVACLTHCKCASGHGSGIVDRDSNSDNPFEGLD
ncbi:hypothetical protein KVR01_004823 [Diaporthe batatas]|uniref:uncharacterized protein n=1 Tax=Diaporthe batatas TaxID=748121 RepID=UPI001D041B3B|nr:uncharacterized protein KVR01_004823 [Diaporthe batatas]KAG8166271.1 hypothetical protein KVR01_004823 [Diaporthe batatas]